MVRKSNTGRFSVMDGQHYAKNLGTVLTEVVDLMDIAIWELDRSYKIVSCNRKALIIYGDDIIGLKCHYVGAGSSSVCSGCPVKELYETGRPHKAELSHKDSDGNRMCVEHFATPIIDAEGSLVGGITLLVDVTKNKDTEEGLQQYKVMLEKIAREKTIALAKSEVKFAVAFDASPDAININRMKDGLYIEVNKGFTELTGFTAEDVVGKTSQEIDIWYHPADRKRLVKHLQEDGFCENLEAMFRRKDGSLTTALMSARIISINDQPYIVSITRDISKIKDIEKKIAAQQRLFETMFNAIEDGIVITNTQHQIQLANNGMIQLFGYSQDELIGMTAEILYADQQEYEQPEEDIFGTAVNAPNSNSTKIYKHKHGSEFPAATFAAKLCSSDGHWMGNLGIMRDITERQKNEAERDKLIAAVQQAGEAIVITDTHGAIEFVNPAFETITGYTKDEILGKNPKVLKSGKHDITFYKELWHTISSGKTFKSRMVNKRKDGSIYTEEATISPIALAEGEIVNYIAVKRDITKQLAMEQQLQQAQKMEAVGRLTGGVAHDFNNMLGVIIGTTEMALEKLPAGDKIHGDLQIILDAAERSATIVRQLLAFSRQQTIAPEKLELNSIVAGMLKMLQRLIGENICIDWIPYPAPLPVKMDTSQMDQILANLCVNAKDAIENHGRISIETGAAVIDEIYCSSHAGCQPGEYAMLTISDDGHGIKEEDLDHIYEPFFTTKEFGRGTGLGLSTVYGIVKQNHGFINVYSEKDRGTTIKVYLPFCRDRDDTPKKSTKEQPIATGVENVILVEDDGAIREMVHVMLTSLGYNVFPVATPQEALELAGEAGAAFHLLLTDVVMPEMNGKELATRLKSIIPALKFLYMSGYTANVIANKGVLNADVNFLQKPFSIKALSAKVRKVLDQNNN